MDLIRLLNGARFYDLSQRLVGKAAVYRHLVRHFIRPTPGQRILDIGCGTGELVRFLPADVRYLGFDLNSNFVATARRRFAHGEFIVGNVDDIHIALDMAIDVAVAVGVMHHLDDVSAERLCRFAARALKPSGRLVTLDPALVPNRSAPDRLLTAFDRGRHVRRPSGYQTLLDRHFRNVTASIRDDLIWFPQTLVIFEAQHPTADSGTPERR